MMKGRAFLTMSMAVLLAGAIAPAARAVDGCVVLLCLAGNWSAIPQCVPPVEQLFADLALGQAFPSCAFASAPSLPASAPATAQAASALAAASGASGPTFSSLAGITQQNCPVQYIVEIDNGSNCSGYVGLISVTVNGEPWSQTLWSLGGASVTCYSSAAESALGISNTPCDQALAAYNAKLSASSSIW